jgi:hypothetical protein
MPQDDISYISAFWPLNFSPVHKTLESAFAHPHPKRSTCAVFITFTFSFLMAATIMALSPDLELRFDDWIRLAGLMGLFLLYLAARTAAFELL